MPIARTKLVEAIIYFAANTKNCGKLKLFKLLYLLDFSHFSETGRSVTDLPYEAWKHGPVPRTLYGEWLCLKDDLAAAVKVDAQVVYTLTRETVVPQRAPDLSVFTKRELRLMEHLARAHENDMTEQMIKATHKEGGPWHVTWRNGAGEDDRIPYELALIGSSEEFVSAIREHSEYAEATR